MPFARGLTSFLYLSLLVAIMHCSDFPLILFLQPPVRSATVPLIRKVNDVTLPGQTYMIRPRSCSERFEVVIAFWLTTSNHRSSL